MESSIAAIFTTARCKDRSRRESLTLRLLDALNRYFPLSIAGVCYSRYSRTTNSGTRNEIERNARAARGARGEHDDIDTIHGGSSGQKNRKPSGGHERGIVRAESGVYASRTYFCGGFRARVYPRVFEISIFHFRAGRYSRAGRTRRDETRREESEFAIPCFRLRRVPHGFRFLLTYIVPVHPRFPTSLSSAAFPDATLLCVIPSLFLHARSKRGR